MKLKIILCLMIVPEIFLGQPVLREDLNLPRSGDCLIKQEITYQPAGGGGADRVWNFSHFQVVDNDHSLTYFSRNNYGVIGTENGQLFSYRLEGDSLLMHSCENPTTLVYYQKEGLLLKFPVVYPSVSEDEFYGRGKRNDRLEMLVTGQIRTEVDAFGSILLPHQDTLLQVVRVHIHKEELSYYTPIHSDFDLFRPVDLDELSDSLLQQTPDRIITDTYQWYKEGYRYPVFETIETYRDFHGELLLLNQLSYFYHPEDQADDLQEDEANAAVRDAVQEEQAADLTNPDIWAGLTYSLSPNPATSIVEVTMDLPRSTSITVQIHTSMGGIYLTEDKGFFPEGENHFSINVSSLPVNNYVLDFWLGDHLVSGILMKR
ncbi:MAG: hypothetical protein LBN18_04470 [Dysgonamonadaceae bacterium]|jgi:hypothetical protein|nr:hypothetical protein [Dysgonamonadaceae bacterium]